jgi:biotin carboxyl carrier protein
VDELGRQPGDTAGAAPAGGVPERLQGADAEMPAGPAVRPRATADTPPASGNSGHIATGGTPPASGAPGPTASGGTPPASGNRGPIATGGATVPPSGAPSPGAGALIPAADPAAPPPPETIARLADDLLPALIARLDASGLGELEVRTDGWRIRLRKPYDRRRGTALPEGRRRPGEPAEATHGRRGEPARSEPGHSSRADGGHGSLAEGGHGDPPADMRGAAARVPVEGDAYPDPAMPADPLAPAIAASPAVGYFTPRDGWTTGRHVRSGDVVGYVDCLGVRQDVLAPVDGFLGRLLAQAGEAVEYGQPLVHLDLPQAAPAPEPAQPAEPPRTERASATASPSGTEPPAAGGSAAAGPEGA